MQTIHRENSKEPPFVKKTQTGECQSESFLKRKMGTFFNTQGSERVRLSGLILRQP